MGTPVPGRPRLPGGNAGAESGRAKLAPLLDFLRRHPPFDRLAPEHLELLASRLELGFYAKGETVAAPADGVAATFYIVKQGRVRGESAQAAAPGDEGMWELTAGECFPVGALLARRAVHAVHRAVEDTFCFELDAQDFDRLIAESAEFRDACTRRVASLLDQALAHAQAGIALEVSADSALDATLAGVVRRAPVVCAAETPLRAALATMHAERVGSIVVTDAAGRPVGIFTLHDLLGGVAARELGLDTPIAEVMTRAPRGLPASARAHEAALLMTEARIGHVCVLEGERLAGVVSERDLFALQRVGLVHLSRSIVEARDFATLAALGQDVQRLIDQMLAQGASIEQLMQLVTLLNDHVTRRVIALCRAAHGGPGVEFSWLAFGSEGRGEQTLKTDQDNGMLFIAPPGLSAPDARARLLPLAQRINAALAEVGFPLCPGNIMAGNPDCCLTLDEWQARFAAWIERGGPEDLLRVSIFFDFRALEGDSAPAARLREWVAALAAATPRFLRQLAENALGNRPPLGLVRDFVLESGGEHPGMLDLKLRGALPIVDGARLLALAHRLPETGTLARLRAAAAAGVLPAGEAEAWCEAYGYIQLLRMRAHQGQAKLGRPLGNFIDPGALNDLDRRILKEAFRQARKLQARIALDYQL